MQIETINKVLATIVSQKLLNNSKATYFLQNLEKENETKDIFLVRNQRTNQEENIEFLTYLSGNTEHKKIEFRKTYGYFPIYMGFEFTQDGKILFFVTDCEFCNFTMEENFFNEEKNAFVLQVNKCLEILQNQYEQWFYLV